MRERAERCGVLLGENEAQTRVSLIDPLLRALGWSPDDPDQVRVEVRVAEPITSSTTTAGDR
ncbi:MAG: hypothetical protein RMK01_11385 [Thermomicrobium sp.]|nr:hypothetical protein [Thermomicrobium sp.]MDW8060664.1 hypothetical protein [Thermomicrobium sp.]